MKRALAVICAATLFAALGQFASYTFFTLLVEESLGSSGGIRTAMLLVYGAAGAVGVWVAGKYYDRRPRLFTLISIATVAGALAIFWLLAPSMGAFAVVATILWGAAFTTVPICLQSSVLRAVLSGPTVPRPSTLSCSRSRLQRALCSVRPSSTVAGSHIWRASGGSL